MEKRASLNRGLEGRGPKAGKKLRKEKKEQVCVILLIKKKNWKLNKKRRLRQKGAREVRAICRRLLAETVATES